ncbi:MAG: hypothetical protein LBK53_06815 [Heliobacteriaceae bacterium]|jgi:hypothetical protein|nr:hypothetical protein [Heliobacteriaceae bacterium]
MMISPVSMYNTQASSNVNFTSKSKIFKKGTEVLEEGAEKIKKTGFFKKIGNAFKKAWTFLFGKNKDGEIAPNLIGRINNYFKTRTVVKKKVGEQVSTILKNNGLDSEQYAAYKQAVRTKEGEELSKEVLEKLPENFDKSKAEALIKKVEAEVNNIDKKTIKKEAKEQVLNEYVERVKTRNAEKDVANIKPAEQPAS